MQVKVSLGSLAARAEAVRISFAEEQPREMKRILDEKAATDRDTHDYQNRTGDAERSTVAGEVEVASDGFSGRFGMGVDYAIYLDRRGLTHLVELAGEADTELGYFLNGERDRLAGL